MISKECQALQTNNDDSSDGEDQPMQ